MGKWWWLDARFAFTPSNTAFGWRNEQPVCLDSGGEPFINAGNNPGSKSDIDVSYSNVSRFFFYKANNPLFCCFVCKQATKCWQRSTIDNYSPESNAKAKIGKIEADIYQTLRPYRLAPHIVHIDALYMAKYPEHVVSVDSFELHVVLGKSTSNIWSYTDVVR